MIIKSILNRIKINKITYILILGCFLTGLVKDLFAIYSLVLFHELGHIIISKKYNWNINRVEVYPFGAITLYDDKIDKPFHEELVVTIMGPLFQIVLYLFFFYLNRNYYITDYFFSLIKNYHYSILLFNLIPIIPLDGSKIINLLLNKLFSYRNSYILLLIISCFNLFIFIIININNTSYIIIFSFLLSELVLYYKNKEILYNRFILEKYLYKNDYKKYKKINSIKQMKRNKKHLIKYNNIYISEKCAIKKIKEYNS